MDDSFTQYVVPDYVLVTGWIEIVACALAWLACFVLVRRAPAAAVVGMLGALTAGTATARSA